MVSKPAPPVRSFDTDRKTSVRPGAVVARFAVGMDTVGMETVGMVSTEDTGDCVLVPDNMTSCKYNINCSLVLWLSHFQLST